MNHLKIGIRFAVVVFWLMVMNALYALATGCANCWVLGLFGGLLYSALILAALYAAVFATIKLWSIK